MERRNGKRAEIRMVEIPDGMLCLYRKNGKVCKLAVWIEHLGRYSCRFYGRLLNGGKRALKCEECWRRD